MTGNFASGLTPWTSVKGGAMCANYGTPSKSPRLRGDLYIDSSVPVQGAPSGRFYLPADITPTIYPLEACSLGAGPRQMSLGTDGYYGLMVYVPKGWTIANTASYGVEIAEYHFQNIYGAPISFELHPDHVTLALEMGACSNYTTSAPGCRYRSNADSSCWNTGTHVCLPAAYAIPKGALVQGSWNEIVMSVHWASDTTGQIQTWYRVAGSSGWNQGSSVSGYPTVQWDQTKGCCASSYGDFIEAYTAALSAPLSVWLDNEITGTGFGAVAAAMP